MSDYRFNDALRAVLPHASRDKSFPHLGVHFPEPGKLAATDRYTAAIATYVGPTVDVADAPEPFTITTADAKDLVKVKATLVAVDLADVGGQTFVTFTFDDGTSRRYATVDCDGSPVERLFQLFSPPEDRPPAAAPFFVAPEFLERFASKHIGKHRDLALEITPAAHPRKAFAVRYGDNLRALVQPRWMPGAAAPTR